ncbi:hypothetical protein SAMN02910370_00997 [Lachnospiraceae bacterium XPB1003]|nr:hypothetical protein SAMN02910370_00997 [Lachnospiraceae bacterium XPB1003]
MADEKDLKAEKKKLAEEKKKFKADQKAQIKEAKKKAKEFADREASLDDDTPGGGFSMFLVTLFIVLIWLAIIVVLVKLDVAGLGSKVLAPVIGNVPVLSKILPGDAVTETDDLEAYYGYSSLADAVAQIQALELELTSAQTANATYVGEIEQLKAEVERLKTFEDQQTEFQRIKTEFYEEVVYADKGPGAEEYKKYYENIDPETAEYLYQQVVRKEAVSSEITDYAAAYAAMDPKEAAQIFNTMGSSLDLVGKILGAMNSTQRGAILGAMDPEIAAQVTRVMEPD